MTDAASEVEVQEKRAKAVELHDLGLSFRQIGQQLGVSKSRANQLWHEAFAQIPAKAVEEHRRLQEERLEYLWERVCTGMRTKPTPGWGLVAIKVLERQAKLYGLDMPAQVHVKAEVKHDDPLADRVLNDPAIAERYLELVELAAAGVPGSGGAGGPGNGARVPATPAPEAPLPTAD